MVEEILAALCGLVFFLAVAAAVLVLPIILLVRVNRLGHRLDVLEGRWRRLASPVPEGSESQPYPRDVPGEPPADRPAARRRRSSVPTAPRPRFGRPPHQGFHLETWVGARALGWVAVLLLLVTTALFLKYAFDNRWIGPTGQVAVGLITGSGLAYAGYRVHQRGGRLFGQMLTAAGIVLLYLATFAAFGFYPLVPQQWGFVFLVAIVLECAALAVLYEAPAVGLMAVVGGLLTPLLMHTETDRYVTLFVYLLVLDAGVVAVAVWRPWPALCTVALLGSQGIFAAWADWHYHPEKRAWALGLQCGLFVLFQGQVLLTHAWRRRLVDVEGLARVVLLASLFAASVFAMLWADHRVWLGTLSVGLAVVYAATAWYVQARRPDDTLLLLTLVAVAMGFVALAVPLQAWLGPREGWTWIPVGWAAQGLALWWFGLRVRNDPLRGMGFVLLAMAVVRLVGFDTPFGAREPFVPFLNAYAVPALIVAGCVLGAAEASRRFFGLGGGPNRLLQAGLGLTGLLLVWFVVSNELYDFVYLRTGGASAPAAWLAAQTVLSAVWAGYALAVLVLGLRLHSGPLRWVALGLFGLTFLKVVFYDTSELSGLYRVAVFLSLTMVTGAAAWGYQRFLRPLAAERSEGVSHEPA